MTGTLLQTPLFAWHAAHGGRMVDFAGWSMPVQYGSIVAEHTATRSAVGLFDVSHMGRFLCAGPGALDFLDHLTTRRMSDMRAGQIRYSLVTRDDGGILDDILVYLLDDERVSKRYQIVVNASNRQKIWDWFEAHRGDYDVELSDITLDTAMIAVQGPRALEIVRPLVEADVARLRYYFGTETEIGHSRGVVSRTGYTGEDGCELVVDNSIALELWEKLHAAAGQFQGVAAGLGARDTLRLEAAMPLYGHELNEDVDPYRAGLDFAVNLELRSFPGHNALAAARDDAKAPRRVGLTVAGRRVPREGCTLWLNDRQVGIVTSGTHSPTFDKPLAMGYLARELTAPGTQVEVDIRGTRTAATVVTLPFYKRPK